MNDADSHKIGWVLSFEKVEHFVFEISVGFRVDVESFPGAGGEVGEGVPGVGGGPFDLQQELVNTQKCGQDRFRKTVESL